MIAGFVMWAITSGILLRIMGLYSFIKCRCVSLVSFSAAVTAEKSFFSPESHRHQARHIKSSTDGSERGYQPKDPAEWNVSCAGSIPENFVFGPEAAERNDSANRQPAGKEGPVRVGHVLLQAAHPTHVLLVMHTVNDTACAEEHQRFKECVRHHVE